MYSPQFSSTNMQHHCQQEILFWICTILASTMLPSADVGWSIDYFSLPASIGHPTGTSVAPLVLTLLPLAPTDTLPDVHDYGGSFSNIS